MRLLIAIVSSAGIGVVLAYAEHKARFAFGRYGTPTAGFLCGYGNWALNISLWGPHVSGMVSLQLLISSIAYVLASFYLDKGSGPWKRLRKKTSAKLRALLAKVKELAPRPVPKPVPA